MVNAVAGAYAESAPVVVISGAPGIREQSEDPLLHHRFGPFSFQREIFERITCAAVVLDDPVMAFRQIDRALARIADGTYGICESCGNPIGKMRAMAFPRATLCMTCKQREERR